MGDNRRRQHRNLDPHTRAAMSAEVVCLVRLYDWEFAAACELIGIEPADFQLTLTIAEIPAYLPLPHEIKREARLIHRDGLPVSGRPGQ
jgi:hypothetical protein